MKVINNGSGLIIKVSYDEVYNLLDGLKEASKRNEDIRSLMNQLENTDSHVADINAHIVINKEKEY